MAIALQLSQVTSEILCENESQAYLQITGAK